MAPAPIVRQIAPNADRRDGLVRHDAGSASIDSASASRPSALSSSSRWSSSRLSSCRSSSSLPELAANSPPGDQVIGSSVGPPALGQDWQHPFPAAACARRGRRCACRSGKSCCAGDVARGDRAKSPTRPVGADVSGPVPVLGPILVLPFVCDIVLVRGDCGRLGRGDHIGIGIGFPAEAVALNPFDNAGNPTAGHHPIGGIGLTRRWSVAAAAAGSGAGIVVGSGIASRSLLGAPMPPGAVDRAPGQDPATGPLPVRRRAETGLLASDHG